MEIVKKNKIDLACEDQFIKQAIETMKKAHLYETPAYDVWKLEISETTFCR